MIERLSELPRIMKSQRLQAHAYFKFGLSLSLAWALPCTVSTPPEHFGHAGLLIVS